MNGELDDLERNRREAAAAHVPAVAQDRMPPIPTASLTDAQAAQPSLLPGWSIGHVLTHLARNADSHVGMLQAANEGRAAAQYPGGLEQRNADIEAGQGRPAAALVADVIESNGRLEAAWSAMTADGWRGEGLSVFGPVAVADLPFRRWRETTLHHTDLGLGYGWSQWPAAYVRLELARMTMQWASRKPMGLTSLPPAAMALPDAQRLAWLTGRTSIEGLEAAGIF